jgi:hypothetical protein
MRKPKNSSNPSNWLNNEFQSTFLERPTYSGVDMTPANPAAREAPKHNWYPSIPNTIGEMSHKPTSLLTGFKCIYLPTARNITWRQALHHRGFFTALVKFSCLGLLGPSLHYQKFNRQRNTAVKHDVRNTRHYPHYAVRADGRANPLAGTHKLENAHAL